MSEWSAIPMLLSGGLFAGGVAVIAWERIPAWRDADDLAFQADFAHTLRQMDRLQPVLVVVCLISTVSFAISASGAARTLAVLAAAGFLTILAGSGAWLVPIQRRLVTARSEQELADTERLRSQWYRGHLIRSIVALVSFTLTVVAEVL